ncbi:MAG: right-handed parallel beta-helix repeat-containing protein [Deltaproteobacteria bacterium]|nr:right-handed parallel beta-helix repeat-containing protein [Deltaproteobacteria bacterium]
MNKKIWLLALVGAVLWGQPVWAQDFYVIAGGGVGTRITSLPYTISNPGFYYLTGNLSFSGTGTGITVASDDVTIDLMGFRISGPGSSAFGIYLFDGTTGHKNVEVRNGTLTGWQYGLSDGSAATSQNNRALNLRVKNCSQTGISLASGGGNQVKGCIADSCNIGILVFSGAVSGCAATNCATGIYGAGTISGNTVSNIAGLGNTGIIITDASNVSGNTVITSDGTQIGINALSPALLGSPVLVIQNTLSGPGLHLWGLGGASVVVVNNAG